MATGKGHSNPKGGQYQRMFSLSDNLLISQASKFMLKILQARLQQYVNQELPDVQAEFRKGLITRDQITNICCILEKQRNSPPPPPPGKSTSASLITLKPLTVWITANCGKFLKRQKYQTTLPVSWEIYMRIKIQ